MSSSETKGLMSGQVPVQEFLRAFPFYFAWNDQDILIEVGPSLRKLCPEARPGTPLKDLFYSKQPPGEFSDALARKFHNQLFVLEDLHRHRILRGSPMFLEDRKVGFMLATAWITHAEQLTEYNLTWNDFGVQDQTLDMLQLLQTQHMAAADLKRINESLIKQDAKLREQEALSRKLALVAARTDNAVIVTDAQARIEWVNEGFTRMTGWTAEEAMGLKPSEFLQGPETDQAIIAYMSDCVKKGLPFSTEVINYHRTGRKYWVALEVQPLFNEAGEVVNFMAIESDVSERRLSEAALRESEATARRQRDELEWIYENAPIGLCFVDRDLRYRRVNRWLAQINGIPIDAHIGRSINDIVPVISQRVEQVTQKIRATRQPMRIEVVSAETPSRPGVTRYFNETWYPAFDADGEVSGYGTVIEEITESKRVQALSEADRRKDEFLATLAHELRNPLGTVSFALDLVLQRGCQSDEHAEQNRSALIRAQRQSRHLVRLVDDLLEVARVSHGKIELKAERVDLVSLLPQAVDLVQHKIAAKHHSLKLDLPPQPVHIDADPVRIVQIFANLLDNASKYTDPGGRIHMTVIREDGEAVVRIRDNGIGIAADKIQTIFEVFSQIKHGKDRASEGIGIGLALARKLVEMHGGRLEARSDGPGQGSEFIVHLPISEANHGK